MRVFCFVCCVLLGAPSARSVTVALVPLDGQGLLPSVRDGLDVAVRRSAESVLGASLQDRAATEEVLADAAAAGMVCSLADAACAARIGVVAGVDEVWVPSTVSRPAGGLGLRIVRVGVGSRRVIAVAVGAVTLPQHDHGVSVAAVVQRAHAPPALVEVDVGGARGRVVIDDIDVGAGPLAAPVALAPGEVTVAIVEGDRVVSRVVVVIHEGVQRVKVGEAGAAPVSLPAASSLPSPTGSTPAPAPLVAPTPPAAAPVSPSIPGPPLLVVAGGATLAVGVVALLAGVVGAGFVESRLGAPGSDPTSQAYRDARAEGLVWLGVAGFGVAIGVAGATLLAFGVDP